MATYSIFWAKTFLCQPALFRLSVYQAPLARIIHVFTILATIITGALRNTTSDDDKIIPNHGTRVLNQSIRREGLSDSTFLETRAECL